MQEILNLHVPAATWLKRSHYNYEYEYWIDEKHRIDFYIKGSNVGFEVANELSGYAAEEKIGQIYEYRRIIGGMVFCLCPKNHLTEHFYSLCMKYQIPFYFITPKGLIPNYRHFITKIIPWEAAIAAKYPNLHVYREIGLGDF